MKNFPFLFLFLFGLGSLALPVSAQTGAATFPVVRYDENSRHFKSPAIEAVIAQFKAKVNDKELGWLFENCFPNTLDTTVKLENKDGKPFTYVITGDIEAMWLRDSSAQVWPYLAFVNQDPSLQMLVAGVINQQTAFILKDPYARVCSQMGIWLAVK